MAQAHHPLGQRRRPRDRLLRGDDHRLAADGADLLIRGRLAGASKRILLRLPPGIRKPLGSLALRTWEALVAARDALRRESGGHDDRGLALPPARLRVLVSGSARIGPYLESGRVDSALIRELVERHGKPMAELEDVLDFGCGCARIARWWADLEGSTIHGCDANPKLAAWTQRNIPFLTAATNGLEPPLPDGDASFDLVYAVSILTHLPRELQACWLDELVRVLRPGGLLLFSVAGERLAGSLGAGERAAFDRGELVVQFEEVAGTNLCAAYHPHAYVRERMLGNLELLESVHEDPSGTGVASPLTRQDIYLARKADA